MSLRLIHADRQGKSVCWTHQGILTWQVKPYIEATQPIETVGPESCPLGSHPQTDGLVWYGDPRLHSFSITSSLSNTQGTLPSWTNRARSTCYKVSTQRGKVRQLTDVQRTGKPIISGLHFVCMPSSEAAQGAAPLHEVSIIRYHPAWTQDLLLWDDQVQTCESVTR